MASEPQKLHIFFFPFPAHGHMIPLIDMAKMFSSKAGAKTTIVTTPYNLNIISKSITQSRNSGFDIDTQIVTFPDTYSSNIENLDQLDSFQATVSFFLATRLLQGPLEKLIEAHRPDCLIADVFFPWATPAAAKFNIPRIVFHGTCFFSLCCTEIVRTEKPELGVSSDTEPFTIPHIPDRIELTKKQLPDFLKSKVDTDFAELLADGKRSELTSFGVIANTFYELEPAYADHYRNVMGRKAWHVGPVSLCNVGDKDKAGRGQEASIDGHECLKWLSLKRPCSVVYVCFGSTSNISASQLREIALGLEASGQDFIWVVRRLGVRKEVDDMVNGEKWLPKGFEERIRGKGMIIRGWAPQVLILDHESVGGVVTHCGWNSTLEGICAGVPMVTWPVFAEQFYNEKLITQIKKIGIESGAKDWTRFVDDSVKSHELAEAVCKLMVGEEAEEIRKRAKELAAKAKRAVEEGGSSYCSLMSLIEDLRIYQEKSGVLKCSV